MTTWWATTSGQSLHIILWPWRSWSFMDGHIDCDHCKWPELKLFVTIRDHMWHVTILDWLIMTAVFLVKVFPQTIHNIFLEYFIFFFFFQHKKLLLKQFSEVFSRIKKFILCILKFSAAWKLKISINLKKINIFLTKLPNCSKFQEFFLLEFTIFWKHSFNNFSKITAISL